jgi:D-methionine transport system substrate-binding protein
MKLRNILITSLFLLSLILVACSSSDNKNSTSDNSSLRPLKIGTIAIPHSEILEFIKPTLKEQGIDLQITIFSEYTQINQATAAGDLDANFYQHLPYLNTYVNESGHQLISIGPVLIAPMAVYSSVIKSMDELPKGALVAYPNDATNSDRAFLLLANNNYIKLKDNSTTQITETDIDENPYNLKFIPLSAEILPRVMTDSTISIINNNYAMEAGLNPLSDSLLREDAQSLYSNHLVVKERDKDNEDIHKLYETLTSESVREFLTTYEGSVIPSF